MRRRGPLEGKRRGSLYCDENCKKRAVSSREALSTAEPQKTGTPTQSNQQVVDAKAVEEGDLITRPLHGSKIALSDLIRQHASPQCAGNRPMKHWRECTTDEEKRRFIEETVEEDLCPRPQGDEDDSDYRTLVVLFAAMVEGTNVCRLTDLTGYPKEFIAAISLNMWKAGLWVEDGVCYENWFEGDLIRPVCIWSDVMVAQGKLIRRSHEDGRFRYSAVRPC